MRTTLTDLKAQYLRVTTDADEFRFISTYGYDAWTMVRSSFMNDRQEQAAKRAGTTKKASR